MRKAKGAKSRTAIAAGILIAILFPIAAHPQDCAVQCQASLPVPDHITTSHYVYFSGSQTHTGNCCAISARWDFGDGTHSGAYSTDHYYPNPGTYPWFFEIWESCHPLEPMCRAMGTVTILPSTCQITCSASVTSVNHDTLTASFQASASYANCGEGGPYTLYYKWDWGDFTSSEPSTSPTATHTYATPGTKYWTLIVKLGSPNSQVSQSYSGSVKIGCQALYVGAVKFCADTITPQGTNTWKLSGNVTIGGLLLCQGDGILTSDQDPPGDQATFSTDAPFAVSRPNGIRTIQSGYGRLYAVDGLQGALTLTDLSRFPRYDLALEGVPIYHDTGLIVFVDDGLGIQGQVLIGDGGPNTLASVEISVLFPPSAPMWIGRTRILLGDLREGYELTAPSPFQYDEAADALDGTVSLKLPYLGDWSLTPELVVSGGCIDSLFQERAFGKDNPIKDSLLSLDNLGLDISDLCGPETSETALECSVGAQNPYFPLGQFHLSIDSSLMYSAPKILLIDQGTLLFSGAYAMKADAGIVGLGKLKNKIAARGTVEIPPVWNGEMALSGVVQADQAEWEGAYSGAYWIYPDHCDNAPSEKKAACLAALQQARSFGVSNFPYVARTGEMDHRFRNQKATWWGKIRVLGRQMMGGEDWDNEHGRMRTLGAFKPVAARAGVRVEAAAAVPAGQSQASFAAVGTTVLPVLTLTTPSGQGITPSNASSFPGVLYGEDGGTKTAVFTVFAPEAGTWTLSSDPAPPQVSLLAEVPEPPPAVAVSSVTRSGSTATIQATIDPPGSDTLVDLLYASSPEDLPTGAVARDLPATSGAVTATWELSSLGTGTYFILARARKEGQEPAEAWWRDPVSVDNGGPLPPTGLTGVRSGSTVALSWTPSPSPGVAGYSVLLTDRPDLPGYRGVAGAGGPASATVRDLDPAKNYRFAVVATDEAGAPGLESAPYETQSCAPACAPSAPLSLTAGQLAPFRAQASSAFCAEPLSLAWDFGDGSPPASGEEVQHAYAVPGEYGWTLTASSSGVSASCEGIVYVSADPVCSLACSATAPESGLSGLPLPFQGSASAEGCFGPARYRWTFGDGASSTLADPAHAYSAPGLYLWTLDVSADAFTCSRSGAVEISTSLPGDCDGSGTVSIGEVQKAINMYLGTLDPGCNADCNGNGTISIGEVQKVINGFLGLPASC